MNGYTFSYAILHQSNYIRTYYYTTYIPGNIALALMLPDTGTTVTSGFFNIRFPDEWMYSATPLTNSLKLIVPLLSVSILANISCVAFVDASPRSLANEGGGE